MSAGGVAVGVGHEPPGQAGQLLVQAGLVAFDGQDPAGAAPGEVGDVVTLAVQRVGGHQHAAQVVDVVQQGGEAGDLVGLGVDVDAGQHDARVLVGGGQNVPGRAVTAA